MEKKNLRPKTLAVHSGHDRDPYTGASSVPIYQVSTYAQADPLHLGKLDYGRGDNLTRNNLEDSLAELEGGAGACAFGSGVAAIASTLMLFKPGDEIVVSEDVYGGTYRLLTTLFAKWGLVARFADMAKPDEVKAAITAKTVALFVETPSNPILKITDLSAIAKIAGGRGLLTIIDNTFMTPYLQRPLDFGFDVSLHSATKFLGGHSDLIAGAAVYRDISIGKELKRIQNTFGAILGPQDSFLVTRGIKTLAVRMEAQQATAIELAQWLSQRPEVRRVYYPGLADHPGYEVNKRQTNGPGAVLSFELKSTEEAVRVMRGVRLPLLGVSLGGVESIISYPATMSHAAMPRTEREARGISDALVRFSVGLEDCEDLKADLEQALNPL